jgi:hypothetical protein
MAKGVVVVTTAGVGIGYLQGRTSTLPYWLSSPYLNPMRYLAFALLLSLLTLPALAGGYDWTWKVKGQVQVIDGDSLILRGVKIRRPASTPRSSIKSAGQRTVSLGAVVSRQSFAWSSLSMAGMWRALAMTARLIRPVSRPGNTMSGRW